MRVTITTRGTVVNVSDVEVEAHSDMMATLDGPSKKDSLVTLIGGHLALLSGDVNTGYSRSGQRQTNNLGHLVTNVFFIGAMTCTFGAT